MKRQIDFIVLLSFVCGFNSCIQQKVSGDNDSSIVVIGNGVKSSVDWSQTLVAGIKLPGSTAVQSLIVEPERVVNVQDRLGAKDRKDAKTPLRLDWIAPGEREGQKVLKLSDSSDPETADKNITEKQPPSQPLYFTAAGTEVERSHFESLQISDKIPPSFQDNGAIYYLAKDDSLRVSFDHQSELVIAQNVGGFFFDQNSSLIFKNKLGEWFYSSKSALQSYGYSKTLSPKFLAKNALVYRTKSGKVFVYPLKESTSSDHPLNAGVVVKTDSEVHPIFLPFILSTFDTSREKVEAVWKEPSEVTVDFQNLEKLSVVQDESFFFLNETTNANDGKTKRRLIELSEKGVGEVSSIPFLVKELSAGQKNIFAKAQPELKSKTVGQVCSRTVGDDRSFVCKTLTLPEGAKVQESILGGDQIVLAMSRPIVSLENKKPSPSPQADPKNSGTAGNKVFEDSTEMSVAYELVALNSQITDLNFGQITQTWEISNPVSELRFFDIGLSKAKENLAPSPSPTAAPKNDSLSTPSPSP